MANGTLYPVGVVSGATSEAITYGVAQKAENIATEAKTIAENANVQSDDAIKTAEDAVSVANDAKEIAETANAASNSVASKVTTLETKVVGNTANILGNQIAIQDIQNNYATKTQAQSYADSAEASAKSYTSSQVSNKANIGDSYTKSESDAKYLTEHQSLVEYRKSSEQDEIDNTKVDKVNGKGLSTNDYVDSDKAKVDEIPLNPKYTDTVYDDTNIKQRISDIENKESVWNNKQDVLTQSDKQAIADLHVDPDMSNFVTKVDGKGLSTNDYTTEEKNKLANVEEGKTYALHYDISDEDPDVDEVPTYTEFMQVKSDLEAEISTRESSDSSLNDGLTDLDSRLMAVYNAKNITLKQSVYENTECENLIAYNNMYLEDYIDIGEIIESGATRYYTDIFTAYMDVANNTDNSITDSTNAVCQLYKNDIVSVIKLLANITITSNPSEYAYQGKIILDLNGYSYTISMTSGIHFYLTHKDDELYIYGTKTGSSFNLNGSKTRAIAALTADADSEQRISMINVVSDISNSNPILIMTGQEKMRVNLYGCSINAHDFLSNSGSGYLVGCAYGADSKAEFHIEKSNIISNNNYGGHVILRAYTDGLVFIKDSYLYADGIDNGDSTVVTILGFSSDNKSAIIVMNSNLYGRNDCMNITGATSVFIEGSELSGGGHGAVYFSSGYVKNGIYYNTHNIRYIKDSILRKTDNTLYPTCNNPYACYFSDGVITFCDNVKFTSYNNTMGVPALKNNTSYNLETKLYLSNCTLDGLRVDDNCMVYAGLGISDDIKQESVSGTIIDTGKTTYGFNLIEQSFDEYDDSEVKADITDLQNKKVGYSEVVENQLLMYADGTKEVLLATLDLPSGGGSVDDVQINGTSIVTDGVANVPVASNAPSTVTAGNLGLVKLGYKENYGLQIENDSSSGEDILTFYTPDSDTAKVIINNRLQSDWKSVKHSPLMATNLDYAVKAALTDGKGAAYTDDEKQAACERLGTSMIVKCTQEEYDLLTPADGTIYVIVEDES